MKNNSLLLVFLGLFLAACHNDYIPKPKAYLRLDYPAPKYQITNTDLPFSFEKNTISKPLEIQKLKAPTESYGINLNYPSLKGTVFLTYKAIDNSEKNLKDYLHDAQKFTLEHTKMADEIPAYPYENPLHHVYGMLSVVKGNVASPAQFYITDSTEHFLTGSLYFESRPNYDSILPAAAYIQKDMRHLMETLKWK